MIQFRFIFGAIKEIEVACPVSWKAFTRMFPWGQMKGVSGGMNKCLKMCKTSYIT